jgi:guanylate kinase
MIDDGEFLEHASVFDNFYGTARRQVENALDRGQDLILEIDWQGAQQVRAKLPEVIDVFILPPSREALEERLRARPKGPDDVIARRLQDSVTELSHWGEFKYVVVNDKFGDALEALIAIVKGKGEHWRSDRPEIRTLAAGLLA